MNTHDMPIRVGKVLRKHREALKMTQEEFAGKHDINPSYYGGIERGGKNLTLLNLVRLADGMGKPLSVLIREAEKLDLERAIKQPVNPPRRGRPPGRKSRWR